MTDDEARGEARRTRRARRAAGLATSGPWQWQWRRQHRRGRALGCMLWLLTLAVVLLVLSLLFGGFHRGTRTGGLGAPHPVTALLARAPGPVNPARMNPGG
jgi:hypothetical protein